MSGFSPDRPGREEYFVEGAPRTEGHKHQQAGRVQVPAHGGVWGIGLSLE